MKKYIVLISFSAALILTIFAAGFTSVSSVRFVRGISVNSTTAYSRLNYSGSVEYSGSVSCDAESSGIIEVVFHKNGDIVEEGEPILSVGEIAKDISSSDIFSSLFSGDDFSAIAEGGSIKTYSAKKAGKLSGLELAEGGFYIKGQTLFKTSDESSYQVTLDVSEKDIPRIRKGQSAEIKCPAIAETLHGTVESIGNTASQTSVSGGKLTAVKVVIKIDTLIPDIKTGYTAKCTITTETRPDTLLVPYTSLMESKGEKYVYVRGRSCVERRAVKTGDEFSDGIEILSGIENGEVIVYDADSVKDPKKTIVNEVSAYAE